MTGKTNAPGAGSPVNVAQGVRRPLQSDRNAAGHSESNRYKKMIGYTTKVFADRYGEVALSLRDEHMNSLGIPHGGIYMAILDAAMGHAVAWCRVPGNVRTAVTISLNTTFLGVAQGRELVARARVLGIDGRVASLSGDVVDEHGTVCVTGQGTFMYLPGSEHPDGIARQQPA